MTERNQAVIGVAGMGVMGSNLAQNMASKGFTTALWNIDAQVAHQVAAAHPELPFVPAQDDKAFVAALRRPRVIVMMITAGAPVDATIERFAPLLEEGDILVDGGNSWFEDTRRRERALAERGIHFVGMGVSGGEEGARLGPSLMPGGTPYAYAALEPVLRRIAAQTSWGPCVTHVGADGAGHFVKMVHNGIEYADMQLIAETYHLLRAAGRNAAQAADVFARWNQGALESFLVELTAAVLRVTDPVTGGPLVEQVLDKAGQKGTGRWTVQAATSLGVAVPTIAAAVDTRTVSALREERLRTADILGGDLVDVSWPDQWESDLESALLAAKIIAYAQGLYFIGRAAEAYDWNIDLAEVARIWTGGCIIRARLLASIMDAYKGDDRPANLLHAPDIAATMRSAVPALRRVVARAVEAGVPVPALGSALAYYDAYRCPRLPVNLVQAQRDAFGAHTYQRVDDPDGPFVHSKWT